MLAALSFLVILTISITITKIATIVLTHTGLSAQAAKFQARSAFTGVGFTTKESEKVVNHPVRRKALMTLMMLGNAGIVTSISSLLVAFMREGDTYSNSSKLALVIVGIVILWTCASSQFFEKHLAKLVEKLLKKYTSLEIKDYAALLHLRDNYTIMEQYVDKELWISDKKLDDVKLWEEGISVLGINRKNGEFIGAPTGEIFIRPDDEMILYGHIEKLKQMASREYGISGDFDHKKAKLEREKEIREIPKETKVGED